MSTLLIVIAAVALVWIVAEHIHLTRAVRRHRPRPPAPRRHPSLTVIRPIRGLDVGAADNVRALLASEYPAPLELLFIFDDESDPAVTVVREVLATGVLRDGLTARILFAGAPPSGRTGKLHAMGLGVREACGELVGFSDSDTRVDADLLRVLVDELLARPDAGDVFAPARADGTAVTAGDVGYALMLDVWYGAPAAALAGESHTLPFIMGQLMIFRREALTQIGGVECADGQLVDDMYLGQRMAATGWRNLIVDRPLHVVTGGMGLPDFLRLMRRWVLFSRSGLPARLTRPAYLHGTTIWLAVLAGAIGAAQGWWLAVVVAVAALAAACVSDRALYRALGGEPLPRRFAWVTVAIALAGPFVAASMWLDHHVDWRGHDYALDGEARLESSK
ncbi:MAG TPA: glycosyltransferase [Polyangia bacterium]|nr:glycosyltransferase [Polyangia bacterium]